MLRACIKKSKRILNIKLYASGCGWEYMYFLSCCNTTGLNCYVEFCHVFVVLLGRLIDNNFCIALHDKQKHICDTKNRRLGKIVTSFQDFLWRHFLANWLAHNKKMKEESVFRKVWSPEMTSQSFPVSCFWSRGFVPHRKCNLTLLQNTGKENRYRKFFFAIHISTVRRFNRANKKNLSYTL